MGGGGVLSQVCRWVHFYKLCINLKTVATFLQNMGKVCPEGGFLLLLFRTQNLSKSKDKHGTIRYLVHTHLHSEIRMVTFSWTRIHYFILFSRLATRVLVVALMIFIKTQQRTRIISNPKLIAIFARLGNIQRANQIAKGGILSFHSIKVTVQIQVIIVMPNFHVNICEQFMIRECMRPSF